MLAKNGSLYELISSGVRVLECSCGPCIGMGQSPADNAVSLRTFNRNFEGRSGTKSAKVYLVSPETAAVSALSGYFTDPRDFTGEINFKAPKFFDVNDSAVAAPSADGKVEVIKGTNIKPFPKNAPLPQTVAGEVLIQLGDNITTDDIMPSNASLLPFRSNVPYLAEFCLAPKDKDFPARAKAKSGGFIVAGENYGQGSSREHAALCPVQLGVKGVIAKSFARIHKANLINNGILPLEFIEKGDYESFSQGEQITVENAKEQLLKGKGKIVVNVGGKSKELKYTLNDRDVQMILHGGLINLTQSQGNK